MPKIVYVDIKKIWQFCVSINNSNPNPWAGKVVVVVNL